jgi:hypothetical protein
LNPNERFAQKNSCWRRSSSGDTADNVRAARPSPIKKIAVKQTADLRRRAACSHMNRPAALSNAAQKWRNAPIMSFSAGSVLEE